MNAAATNEPRPWPVRRFWAVVAMILLAHFVLIFSFEAKKPRTVRSVTRVPVLHLANADDEFIALGDPSLFALPHANDFGAAIRRQMPAFTNSFHWDEPLEWLPFYRTHLLNAFDQFMRTNLFAASSLDFKPEPLFSEPALPVEIPPLEHSTLSRRGELAQRTLLTPLELANWPETDVIAPSKVQVLVDAEGRVISAVLLPPDYGSEAETRDDNADRQAVELALTARFAPASHISMGQMIFNWHVIPRPVTATNVTLKLP